MPVRSPPRVIDGGDDPAELGEPDCISALATREVQRPGARPHVAQLFGHEPIRFGTPEQLLGGVTVIPISTIHTRQPLRLVAGRVGHHRVRLRGFAVGRQDVAREQRLWCRRIGSNTDSPRIVERACGQSPTGWLRVWVGPAALILVVGMLGTFRPVLQLSLSAPGTCGVHQPILPSETTESSADDRPRGPNGVVSKFSRRRLLTATR